MNLAVYLLIGLIAGWLTSMLVQGRGSGAVSDIVIGIAGAVIGGYVFNYFDIGVYGFWGAVAMSVVGAVLFLTVIRLLTGLSSRKDTLLR